VRRDLDLSGTPSTSISSKTISPMPLLIVDPVQRSVRVLPWW